MYLIDAKNVRVIAAIVLAFAIAAAAGLAFSQVIAPALLGRPSQAMDAPARPARTLDADGVRPLRGART
jgi:hypothetical protein